MQQRRQQQRQWYGLTRSRPSQRPLERAILLTKVVVSHAPNFDGEGCLPRLELEKDWQRVLVVDAPVKSYRDNVIEMVVPDGGVKLQGDVCIRMFHQRTGSSSFIGQPNAPMFRLQLNTAYMDRDVDYEVVGAGLLVFRLAQLDDMAERPLQSYQQFNSAMQVRVHFEVLP